MQSFFNSGFVVEEIFELAYTIKSRCFESRYKTWTPQSRPPYRPPLFLNDGKVSRLSRINCMYFQMIPVVNKFLDDQQSIELRRIRTTSFTVYLYDILKKTTKLLNLQNMF